MFRTALKNPLAIVAFLFPVLAVFDAKRTAIVLILILLGCLIAQWPPRPRLWPPLIAGLCIFSIWALMSALWSIDANHSLLRFLRLSLTLAGGVLLCGLAAAQDAEGRRNIGIAFSAGFLLASLISILAPLAADFVPWPAVAEYIHWMPLLAFGAIATLAIFVLAAGLDTSVPLPVAFVAIAAAAIAILFRGNTASGIALIVATGVFVAVLLLGRRMVVALAVMLPILFLAPPMLLQTADIPARAKESGWTFDHSAGHRLIVWRYVFNKIMEKPALGWGLHTARILPDRLEKPVDDPVYADIFASTKISRDAKIELMPMHPHNATLQSWLELGAVGAVLYAALFLLAMLGLSRLPLSRIALASGAGLGMAIFVIGQLSFSAWQSWWLSCQILSIAAFLFLVRKATAAPGKPG
jgi:exopolysaccharide production protein ExoQ